MFSPIRLLALAILLLPADADLSEAQKLAKDLSEKPIDELEAIEAEAQENFFDSLMALGPSEA